MERFVIYRQESDVLTGVSESASIGLAGYTSGKFLSLTDASAAPGTNNITEVNTINTKPANGQMYTFMPPVTTGLTYDWSANTTFLSATNIANPVAQAMTSAQTYTVTVTDGSSGCANTQTIPVAVSPSPDPTANSSSPVCEGQSLSLFGDNIASGQSTGNSYAWSGPNGFSDVVQNPTINGATPAAGGTYTLTVTNQFGCSSTTTHTVVINPLPALSIARLMLDVQVVVMEHLRLRLLMQYH